MGGANAQAISQAWTQALTQVRQLYLSAADLATLRWSSGPAHARHPAPPWFPPLPHPRPTFVAHPCRQGICENWENGAQALAQAFR